MLDPSLRSRDRHDRLTESHNDEEAEALHDVADVVALGAHGPAVPQGAGDLPQRRQGPQCQLAVAAHDGSAEQKGPLDEAGDQVHAEGVGVLVARQVEGDDQAREPARRREYQRPFLEGARHDDRADHDDHHEGHDGEAVTIRRRVTQAGLDRHQ